jgi:uncharacterized membrane protein
MTRKLVPIYAIAWRAMIFVLSVEIAVVSVLRYFTDLEPPPAPIVANAFADPFLAVHVAGGVVALLVGPLQFVRPIRARWPAFHRASGRLYVAACAIGAPTGFVLALGSVAGPAVNVGFAIPAVLCALFTWLGWKAAVERRFADHSAWMLRSYAVIAAALTLRLLIPASAFLDLDFFEAYRVNAWLAWIINLLLVELMIRRLSRRTAGSTPRATGLAAPSTG